MDLHQRLPFCVAVAFDAVALAMRELVDDRASDMLLDPEVDANALTWAADADKTRTPAIDPSGQGSSLVRQVPPAGFEPATVGSEVQPEDVQEGESRLIEPITSKEFGGVRWSRGPISGPSFS
jgi:hypothetical protein